MSLKMINKSNESIDSLKKKEQLFLGIVKKESDNAVALSNLGTVLRELGDYKNAEKCYKKSISINSNSAIANYNYAVLLKNVEKFNEAVIFFRKAITIEPDFYQAYCDLGMVLKTLGQFRRAEKCYIKTNELKPDNIETLWNLSFIQLVEMDFKNGWENYRYRYHDNKIDRNKYTPAFLGVDKLLTDVDDIKGKKIFIYTEMTYCEMVMFSRFLPIFAKKGARKIVFAVNKPLRHLLEHSFKGISFVTEKYSGKFDYHLPLCDAGYIFNLKRNNIKIRGRKPYLRPCIKTINSYKNKFFNNQLYKIGFIWRDNSVKEKEGSKPANLNEFINSIVDTDLQDNASNLVFYSFQKGITDTESEILKKNNILDVGSTFYSFSDTAAAIDNLDLLITIDSVEAHISAALGKKTWIVLGQYFNNWYWGIKGEKSYWYDSVTLYRQMEKNNICQILNVIKDELNSIMNN